jgi:NADH-quinone oxidoreductase subunit L
VTPQLIVIVVSVAGAYLAWLLFARRPAPVVRLAARPGFRRLASVALAGWGFDHLYDAAFVRPFLWLARKGKEDVIDTAVSGAAWLARSANGALRQTQSGRMRYYLAAAAFGVVVFVAVGLVR